MGFWKSARGINGDSWADEMDRCMKALATMTVVDSKLYGAVDHEITMEEFADLVEFCTRGHLIADVRFPERDGERPLSNLHGVVRGVIDLDTQGKETPVETYGNRGQVYCSAECEVGD